MPRLGSKDLHCLLRVSHSAVTVFNINFQTQRRLVFLWSNSASLLSCVPSLSFPPPLYLCKQDFPSLHYEILN